MKDIVMTIRLPSSLFSELKQLPISKSYMDISEEIRSIVRHRWQESSNPELYEIRKLKQEISDILEKKIVKKSHELLIKELDNIKHQVKREVFDDNK